MGSITLVVISLFLFILAYVSGQTEREIYIATGRGVLVPDASYNKIQEVPFNNSHRWRMSRDSRFPNGLFIHSSNYNLVWDVAGGAATNGAPIVLYQKKNTLVDTKNQRWVNNSAGQFEIIMNSNYVAKVNSNKKLVLATKSATDPFQKFYILDLSNNMTTLYVSNGRTDTVRIVAANSILGNYLNTTVCQSWCAYIVLRGDTINVFDAAGNYVKQNIFMHSQRVNLSLYMKYPSKLPEGTSNWTGQTNRSNPTIDSSIVITLTASDEVDGQNGVVSGSGVDAFGTFTLGGYYVGRPGNEWDYLSLTKSYPASVRLWQTCEVEAIGTTVMEGFCDGSGRIDAPSNSFRWEKVV